MTNLRLANFLIIGIALMFGIICAVMHEREFATILIGLAVVQILLVIVNWKIKKNDKNRSVRRFVQPRS